MIPSDIASSLRLLLPEQRSPTAGQTQPVIPAQHIADVLGDLVPGQRMLAEILAVLPNGNYRAVVAQRDITLALPFTAKSGDSLELEVVESDGKTTLAVVSNRSTGQMAGGLTESATSTLSQTGKLISDLIGSADAQGKRAAPAPLNTNQPLINDFPDLAANLAPVLKEALTKSGVFYEAHQARWVAGELSTESLKQEPQGKFSAALTNVAIGEQNVLKTNSVHSADQASNLASTLSSRVEAPASNPVPRDLMPIVQQQLDGLANQNFAWQGQVWPGQLMRWEIGENLDDSRSSSTDEIQRWQTRLKLSLPLLGDIDVSLNLKAGGEVSIAVTAGSESSESRLRDETMQLRQQFEAAGLNLTELQVVHGETAE